MTLHDHTSHALSRGRLTRRAALRLLGTGLGVSLLAACAPAQAPAQAPAPAPAKPTEAPKPAAPAPTAAPAAPAATSAPAAAAPAKPAEGKPEAKTVDTKPEAKPGANQPKSGGVLRAGLNGDITSIWPNFGGTSSLEVNAGMFDRLLTYDKNLQVVPGLVESWDQSSDLKQVKLNIRKNVTFHNGRELTSDDVVYTLQRATDPTKTSPLTLVGLAKVWELSAPDKYTVIMKSDQPRISAFDLLTQLTVGDKGTLEGPDGKTKGMGTGPFVFQDWIQGDKIVYTKNKNYWQSGKPYLDGYQFTFYRDAQAMMTTLEAGSLDFVSYPQISDALRLRNDPKYAVQGIWDAGNAFAIWVTCTNAPFTDKKVRQAFAWAMDRKRIAETTLGGLAGPPRNLPWATYSPAYEPAKENTYGFDLDKAKSMLNAAGITSLDTVVNYASNSGPVPEFAQMAQIFQSDLSKIGVNLRIEPMDNATWVDAATKAAYKGFGIGMPGNFGAQDATAGLATGAFGQANSFTGFKSETYTQLYNEASVEPDPAKRKALYSKINDLILDECFTMTLTSFLQTSATSAKVHNTGRHPVGGGLILAEAWMD